MAGTFALMGGSLIAGAGKRAADAVVWENERRRHAGAEPVACDGPFLNFQLRLNRGFGAAAVVLGAVLSGAGLSGRFLSWRPSGAVSLALGAALIVLGLAGAGARLLGRRAAPRFVQDAAGAPDAPLSERAGDWLSWTMRFWWLGYGARLLWGLRG